MIIEVKLTIPIKDLETCKSVKNALEPDNATAPPQISITIECENSAIIVHVKGKDVNILTFRNTVDDLMEHLSLATKLLEQCTKQSVF
ncbi:MAG: CTAG/PCC1 family protein [Ignisphaera sp.]|nr:CTAG/PCC1 family protein [Ignisphaera sp.]